MERWTLIVCFNDGTWVYDHVEVNCAHIDNEDQVKEDYIDNYKDDNEKEISFIGVYSVENIDDEDC